MDIQKGCVGAVAKDGSLAVHERREVLPHICMQ